MVGIISYCGLNCETCKIYLASRESNQVTKEKMIYDIINKCKTHYGVDYKYEDITNCDGCKTTAGSLFSGCVSCKIRQCAINKGLENCAYCDEYICDKLCEIYKTNPCARTRLDLIRGTI